jgi:hypothetical protein
VFDVNPCIKYLGMSVFVSVLNRVHKEIVSFLPGAERTRKKYVEAFEDTTWRSRSCSNQKNDKTL